MTNYILYLVTILLLLLSTGKDRRKTKMALRKAWKAFANILPEFSGVILLVGIMLAVFNAEFISSLLGPQSGWLGVIFAAVVGAITLIPGFVAFPTAALLLEHGAGYMQIAAFVSSLMMVGIVTMPIEIKYFGKRLAFARNALAFGFSLFVAFVIGKVVGGV
ncbi:MAG: permease [bacterium]|jgi:uncharacterized membrane protein YraQ (UPF0718 family)